MSAGKRITILSKDEVEYLYGIPKLTDSDRMVLFDLEETDHHAIRNLPNDAVKIDYIIQLGYFRAKKYFSVLHSSKSGRMSGSSLITISRTSHFLKRIFLRIITIKIRKLF